MPTKSKRTVLLSEGSSNSARQVLYGLRGTSTVDILDPAAFCQCRYSLLVRRWHRCPSIAQDPQGYLRFLVDRLKRQRYDVLLPTHEQVYLISRFREQLSQLAGLAVPDFDSLRQLQGKADFWRLMTDLGVPVPETKIVTSKAEARRHDQFPCYVKLPHSTASLGVAAVANPEELHSCLAEFQQLGRWTEGDELLLQQPARGRQAEVSAVFQQGQLIAVACADVLETGIGGGPARRQGADHPSVLPHLHLIGKTLQWHGPLVLEYFYDSVTKQPEFIEANPRIGETFNAMISGVNIAEITARLSQGERFDELVVGQRGKCSHNGFILLIADAYNGASRRQLLHRIARHWLGKGEYQRCESEMTRPCEDIGSLLPASVVSAGLILRPSSAIQLTENTVANYSLPLPAVQQIHTMDFPL